MSRCKPAVISSFCIALLGGCASSEVRTFFPPTGSQVVLKQELNARSSTRVFIQNGQVMERNDVNRGNPNCQFMVRSPSGETGGLTIQPDTFTVTRTFRESRRETVNATMITFMDLSSDAQPQVSQLACQRWGSPRLDSFLTIDEMKATLSPVVELNIGGE